MPLPIMVGPNLDAPTWNELRLRAIFDYCKWDTQCGDRAMLARFPLIADAETMQQLAALAEALTREALVAEKEILAKPKLLKHLGLSSVIRDCLSRAGTEEVARNVRVMRFDFHYTTEGWRISEVNADVPGGYVEASGWNALLARRYDGTTAPPDPTEKYANSICAELAPDSLIALIHATVYSEDRQVMVHLGRALQGRGMQVCLASPRNLSWRNGVVFVNTNFKNGTPAFVVRLSPAEWLPGEGRREHWAGWFEPSSTPLSNPGRALILQSKRFPLTWHGLASELPTWRRLLPETRCPSDIRDSANGEWVLKPAFGRVGEDVGIRGVSSTGDYERIREAARRHRERWVAQRRFQVMPVATGDGEVFPCIGVYTVNGQFAGLYGRAACTPLINEDAFDVAVLIRNEEVRSVQ